MRRTALLQLLPLAVCLLVIAALVPWKPQSADCGDPEPQSAFYALSTFIHVVCFIFLLFTLFKVAAARHSLAGNEGRPGWPFILSSVFLGWIAIAALTSPGSDSLGKSMLAMGAIAVVFVAVGLVLPAVIALAIVVGRAFGLGDEVDKESLLSWQIAYLVLLSLAVFVFLPASAIAFDVRGPLFCM